MEPVKRRRYSISIMVAAGVLVVWSCLILSAALVEPYAHVAPDYPKEDIVPILSQDTLSEADYQRLFYQTGLGKPAIDELRGFWPDSTRRIQGFQENLFRDIRFICEKNSPISKEEAVVDEKGLLIHGTELASAHNGYILITKSSHTFGWRNGHAALIVDATQGKTLESAVLGTRSCVQGVEKWVNYPNFVVLRLKNASSELLNEISQSALSFLNDIPYDLTVGILKPKFARAEEIRGTHCSHLVWEAFRLFGYDLDSDGGMLVTPKDIVNSPLLEVVQAFGVNPKDIWS